MGKYPIPDNVYSLALGSTFPGSRVLLPVGSTSSRQLMSLVASKTFCLDFARVVGDAGGRDPTSEYRTYQDKVVAPDGKLLAQIGQDAKGSHVLPIEIGASRPHHESPPRIRGIHFLADERQFRVGCAPQVQNT